MIQPYIYKPTDGTKDNSRIIPALFPALLALILIMQWKTASANIEDTQQARGVSSTDRATYDAVANAIQRQPYNAQRTLELGRFFLAVHQDTEARAMLLRANALGMHEEILRPFLQFLDDRETSPSAVLEKLNSAQQRVADYPQWRDGWYLVAQYAFVLRKFDVSRDSLDRVLALDPNFEPARELLRIVEK